MERIHSADYWVQKLGLQPHPEGGYYKEIYRGTEGIEKENLPVRYSGARPFATAIYYLLQGNDLSAFHRIQSDEIWVYIDGRSANIYSITGDGKLNKEVLGTGEGAIPQIIIPKLTWFAANLVDKNSFILVSCFVAPGFDFSDFELADREKMLQLYPLHKDIIEKFTK
jgi:predicted cupin superfamily sugar epimerase